METADRPRPVPLASGRQRRGAGGRAPVRIRQLAAAAALGTLALAVLLTVEIGQERDGLATIADRSAPEVVATSDLYFALNDMDAQVANVLLVGDQQNLGLSRTQALNLYEQRRRQADQDVQRAASAAADPVSRQALDSVLDDLGSYEALAAQTILLDQQAPHAAGRPSTTTLARYRQATDLLKGQLLPAAQRLNDAHARTLDSTYRAQYAGLGRDRTLVIAVGAVALAVLLALQVYLTRRFRRLVNPALAAATVLAAIGLAAGAGLLSGERTHLRVAKQDAFDSIMALTRARAISYDANADESRYLVDPGRADQYQQSFLAKSQQLVALPGATLGTWNPDLAGALSAYQRDHHDIGWGGLFGTEFHNVTFSGEGAQAETTLLRLQSYELDDRRIRALAADGRLDDAIALDTSYASGGSDFAFDQYDKSLAALIAINQHAFDGAIAAGRHGLNGWTAYPWVGCGLVLTLLVAGVRPRLSEYR
ncbi:hypothetical protein GCM10023322_45060 [Rugosimonospora acidiphila]|uniref:Secreted protein n=1 Tax=Rugosimonospora acidiphila TaxID=556531 RepID=A0ABP9S1L3_9ACTN